MIDIVIDTCTLKHATDPSSKYFEHSVELINRMRNNNVKCAVDEGFSMIESDNTSFIGHEYITHLKPGSLGYVLISHLAQSDRIDIISNKPPNSIKRFIEQLIRNKKDRMFLRVTYNSKEQILASHDFTDYQITKRRVILKKLKLSIVTAEEINDQL